MEEEQEEKTKKRQRLRKLITNWVQRVLFKFSIRPKGLCLQLASLCLLHINEEGTMEYFCMEANGRDFRNPERCSWYRMHMHETVGQPVK
jgi:hypothetical protein